MYKMSLVRVERWIGDLRVEADAGSLDWGDGEWYLQRHFNAQVRMDLRGTGRTRGTSVGFGLGSGMVGRIRNTNQSFKDLYNTIMRESEMLEEISQLHGEDIWQSMSCYYGDVRDTYEFITWLLVVDGCSILHLLEKSGDSVDPHRELKISVDKLVRMYEDLLVMDNQIPFQVLRLFCKDEARLEKCLHTFLQVHGVKTAPELGKGKKTTQEAAQELKLVVQGDYDQNREDPVHLLDYLRRALLMRDLDTIHKEIPAAEMKIKRRSLHLTKYRIGSIRELKAAGISLRRHSAGNSIYPSFKDGILHLPELVVDGTMPHIFLNLVAYEMTHFHSDFEISSYLVLLSSLVDQPEDVKELRLAGILINELASDKEVSDLFNKMDIILVPETPWFANIRDQIHSHFESKRGRIKILTWMGEAYNTFFRSPWTIIALLAATLGLVLTFIQTWFAIHPKAS
ncbi:UPF0481 protein [Arachis hypogaea]|uniref:UPF0481 protein n=2 Tax=Arachis hypogaea TaxID=3818 RepID=A0A6B9V3S6_ARAHY|nr:UPF0481 protein [Arachis hypogaea]